MNHIALATFLSQPKPAFAEAVLLNKALSCACVPQRASPSTLVPVSCVFVAAKRYFRIEGIQNKIDEAKLKEIEHSEGD